MRTVFKDHSIKLILIITFAFIVRMVGVTTRPIWYDEAFSILFSEKGLGQMVYGTLTPTGAGSADIHPLGYYAILWGWMKLFGQSLVATRLLSIVAGLGVVFMVYLISKELFDIATAITGAILAALSPFQIHYAQEIRMYAFLTLWLLLAAYSYLRGSKSGNWGWWLVFGISTALGQYTHNLAAFFLITLALTPVFRKDWKTLRSVVISGLFAIFLYLPWLINVPAQILKVDQAYWVTKPDFSKLFTLFLVFTANTPLPPTWVLPTLTAAISIVFIGLMQTVRSKNRESSSSGLWSLYLALFPPLLLFLFSQKIPVYIERALLPSGVFFCIWLAWVIQKTNLPAIERIILITLLAPVFTAGNYQHLTYTNFPYGSFKDLSSYLVENTQPKDLILHSNKLSLLPTLYFDRSLPQSFIRDLPGGATDTLAFATQQVLELKAEMDISSAVIDTDRVWYIIYQRSIDEYTQAGRSSHPDIDY